MSDWHRTVRHGEPGWQIGTSGVESTIFISDSTPLGQLLNADLSRRDAPTEAANDGPDS